MATRRCGTEGEDAFVSQVAGGRAWLDALGKGPGQREALMVQEHGRALKEHVLELERAGPRWPGA